MASTKTIKGITIEIAGDTTKLGKALKGVDAQSQDLAASLKYVDRLLDLDPGNTELLAEKQKLLTDAVDNTNEKLETLKSVQDQIKRQYASGEIGQRAYLDFSKEVMLTEKKLKDLRAESDLLAGSLNDTGREARSAAGDLDALGDGANGSATELGGLGDSLDTLVKGGKIAAVVGALGGIASAVGGIVSDTQEYREEMAKLDVAFEVAKLGGEAAQIAYQSLYRVLGETDQSVEASQQIALLADSTEQVARWAGVAPGLVARFGDALQPETFYESANETLKLGEATGAFVQLLEGTGVISVDDFNKKLQSLTTEEDKQNYMLELTESLLGDAATAYEERNRTVLEARDADARWEAAMAGAGEALAPLTTGAKNFGADVVEWLVPKLETGVSALGSLGGAFSDLGKEMSEDWPEVVEWWDGVWTGFTDGLKGVSDGIREFFGGAVDESSLAEQELGQNFAAMNGHMSTSAQKSGEAAQTFYDPWIGIGASFGETCEGLAQSYRDAVDYIKSTPLTVPDPKIPEFSINGKFALQPPSVPKIAVAWNAKGGILTEPTIFGALGGNLLGGGEAGQEAVLPLDSFYDRLEAILRSQGGGNSQLIVNVDIASFVNNTDQDIDELTNAIGGKLLAQFNRRVSSFA